MKILPITIREQTFKKKTFGGYCKKDVHAYLEQLSGEWQELLDKNEELEEKLKAANLEIAKLREIESSLLGVLKDTEEAREKMLEQTRKESRMEIMKARMKAEKMVEEAKERSQVILRDANDKYKDKVGTMRKELKDLERQYSILDSHSDKLIDDMMKVVDETVDKLRKLSNMKKTAYLESSYIKQKRGEITKTPKESTETLNGKSKEKAGKPLKNSDKSQLPKTAKNGKMPKTHTVINSNGQLSKAYSQDANTPPLVKEPNGKTFFEQIHEN